MGEIPIVLTDGTGSFGSRLNFAQSTRSSNVVGYVGYNGSSGLALSNSSSTTPLQIRKYRCTTDKFDYQ